MAFKQGKVRSKKQPYGRLSKAGEKREDQEAKEE